MSIYKDKTRNTWYFQIRKKDIYGEWKRITKRGFKTQSEAKLEQSREMLKEVKIDTSLTFYELYNKYISFNSNRLKERNLNIIENRVNNHIMPYFKNKKINQITTNDIIKWQELLNKYSLGYRQSLHITFSAIINFGMKHYNINKNPLSLVGNFKDNGELKKEMNFFTKEEFDNFIKEEDNIVYNTFFNLLYYTGLRLGEALALNWNDYRNKSIFVKKTLSNKIKDKQYSITTPKTKSSIRSVLLTNNIISMLDNLKLYYKKFDRFNDNWFIFGGVRPLAETSIRRRKINACKKTESKKEIRIHDFRHSHASLLINLGADILYISKRLGHSNITETLNTYSHLYPSKQQEIVDILNKL